jgi:hypothetical protein
MCEPKERCDPSSDCDRPKGDRVNAQPDLADATQPEPPALSPELAELKLLVTTYYALQDHRIMIGNRIWALTERLGVDEPRAERLHARLMGGVLEGVRERGIKDLEASIARDIFAIVREHELWQSWLVDVKGIGPILAGGYLAGIGDIGRFETISKLWAYSGQHTVPNTPERAEAAWQARVRKAEFDARKTGKEPVVPTRPTFQPARLSPRRVKGERANWSPFLSVVCWKTGESFVKTRGAYRAEYDRERAKYERTRPDTSDGHRHNMAKRATVKLFMAHLWETWRTLDGLPIRAAYVIDQLGHTTVIPPLRDEPKGE